jgi:hypothetical protein
MPIRTGSSRIELDNADAEGVASLQGMIRTGPDRVRGRCFGWIPNYWELDGLS